MTVARKQAKELRKRTRQDSGPQHYLGTGRHGRDSVDGSKRVKWSIRPDYALTPACGRAHRVQCEDGQAVAQGGYPAGRQARTGRPGVAGAGVRPGGIRARERDGQRPGEEAERGGGGKAYRRSAARGRHTHARHRPRSVAGHEHVTAYRPNVSDVSMAALT